MTTTSAFASIEEVVAYLKTCRLRKNCGGDWEFEPLKSDRTTDVKSFFRDNPQHQVSLLSGSFIGISQKNLDRLNAALSQELRIDPSQTLVVDLAKKYARRLPASEAVVGASR